VAIRALKQLFNGSRQLHGNRIAAAPHSQERASRNSCAVPACASIAVFEKESSVFLKCRPSNSGDKLSRNTMKANDTDNHERSRRELADGVLKQAQRDLQRFHSAPSAIERELYLDAYRWVTSDDSTWPFSFLTVCESLNLVPENVRQDLIDLQSLGALGTWARRCTQGVKRVHVVLGKVPRNRRHGGKYWAL
jgi:hypothetical protein